MTYSYDPTDLGGKTLSRARFELGDTMVDGEGETCMLCDEEILAVLSDSTSWKRALYRLADAVCMKLSYETDWSDDGASFNLNQRAANWQEIRKRLKTEAEASDMLPRSGAVDASMRNPDDGGHYFYGGMMANPNVKPPMPFRGDT